MIDETALRNVLVSLAELAKMQTKLIYGMGAEVQALHNAVMGLDSTLPVVMAMERQEGSEAMGQTVEHITQEFDVLIQQLKDGSVC